MRDFRRLPSTVSLAIAIAAASLSALSTVAGAAVSGPITCSVENDDSKYGPVGLLFKPFLNAVPRNVGLKATNGASACDDSGVTGAKGPITTVEFKLTARLSDGTCAGLTGTPQLTNAKITVRWQGTNPTGRPKTVATSKARIASASYDSGTDVFTLVTEPIYRGAFAGQTATLRLGFDSYVDGLEAGCGTEGGFLGVAFGNTNPSSLEVQ